MKRFVTGVLAELLVTTALTNSSFSLTLNWNGDGDAVGSFTVATNWTDSSNPMNHIVPGASDTAIFNLGTATPYNVTFAGRPILSPLTRSVRKLTVGTNPVTFSDSVNINQLPATFAIDPTNMSNEAALTVGDSFFQTATLNSTLADLTTSSITVGRINTATGTVNVSSGKIIVTGSPTPFIVGDLGSGFFNITGGADVSVTSGSSIIGRSNGSTGTVSVSGSGSTWEVQAAIGVLHGTLNVTQGAAVESASAKIDGTNSEATVIDSGSSWTVGGGMVIGEFFSGKLTIENGADVVAANAMLASMSGSGTVEVNGAGSTWTIEDTFLVGANGDGVLIVDGGATVTSGLTILGSSVNASGTVRIDGAGSTWSIGGNLIIGPTSRLTVSNVGAVSATGQIAVGLLGTIDGNGTITGQVDNGGVVSPGTSAGALHINGNYNQLASSPSFPGALKIELGGNAPGTSYDQLLVSGNVVIDGNLDVSLINDFMPQAGDTFNILDFANLSGTFDIVNLPTLTGPITWNTSQLYTNGVLTIASTGIPGDYNSNGVVDAADYVVWRNGGSPDSSQAGYNLWRANFGKTTGSSAALSPIPEPSTLLLTMAALVGLSARRHKAA